MFQREIVRRKVLISFVRFKSKNQVAKEWALIIAYKKGKKKGK